jgi:hypothetical protein
MERKLITGHRICKSSNKFLPMVMMREEISIRKPRYVMSLSLETAFALFLLITK